MRNLVPFLKKNIKETKVVTQILMNAFKKPSLSTTLFIDVSKSSNTTNKPVVNEGTINHTTVNSNSPDKHSPIQKAISSSITKTDQEENIESNTGNATSTNPTSGTPKKKIISLLLNLT